MLKSLRRTRAIITKEFKHIRLDPGFLFLTILSPAVLLTLLSYIFSFDVENTSIAIFDNDQTPQSHAYVQALTADGDIRIVAAVENYDQITDLFRAGEADAAVVIPPGFGRKLASGQQAEVNLVADGSDVGTAFQVISGVEQRTQAHAVSIVGQPPPPFDIRFRIWFNENLVSQDSMVPGLMALVLILPAMAVALGVAREKESGTFESLITTPIQGSEYLLGKLVVFLVLGVLGGLLALAVAVFWFRVPFRGNLGLFILLTADYLFALMGFCLVIANFVRNQRTVTTIVLLSLFIPSFFLTGLILPVDKSSLASQGMAFSIPSTHYIIIARGLALKGITLAELWPEALTLFGMGLIAVTASVLVFSKKLK